MPDSRKTPPPDFDPFGPRPGWGDEPETEAQRKARVQREDYLRRQELNADRAVDEADQRARNALSRFNDQARADSVSHDEGARAAALQAAAKWRNPEAFVKPEDREKDRGNDRGGRDGR